DKIDNTLTEIIIPSATWAIFSGHGTYQSILKLMMRVHTEWLPSSGYDFGNAPEIKVYYYSDDPTDTQYEIWLPVVPKA
ncbi:MAG: GyrI-like domain-containing protein, partial [Clostridia bacterium]